jgi:hypothetical protein
MAALSHLGKAIALVAMCLAPLAALPAPATPEPVDLELVIASDNSQSIDPTEAALERQGVAAAFSNEDVVKAIQSGSLGKIAVAYLDWSSAPYTRIVLNWRIIEDKKSADAFAAALLAAPPPYGQGTAIGEAIAIAARMIETNSFQGTQRVIDVAGDGPNNRGRPVALVRDEVVARGITINGLPIVVTGEYGTGDWGAYYGKLDEYYMNCVIGGRGSFSIPAHGFQDFANAVRRKLILEISGDVPPAPHGETGAIVKVAAAAPVPSPSTQNCISGYRGFGGFGNF